MLIPKKHLAAAANVAAAQNVVMSHMELALAPTTLAMTFPLRTTGWGSDCRGVGKMVVARSDTGAAPSGSGPIAVSTKIFKEQVVTLAAGAVDVAVEESRVVLTDRAGWSVPVAALDAAPPDAAPAKPEWGSVSEVAPADIAQMCDALHRRRKVVGDSLAGIFVQSGGPVPIGAVRMAFTDSYALLVRTICDAVTSIVRDSPVSVLTSPALWSAAKTLGMLKNESLVLRVCEGHASVSSVSPPGDVSAMVRMENPSRPGGNVSGIVGWSGLLPRPGPDDRRVGIFRVADWAGVFDATKTLRWVDMILSAHHLQIFGPSGLVHSVETAGDAGDAGDDGMRVRVDPKLLPMIIPDGGGDDVFDLWFGPTPKHPICVGVGGRHGDDAAMLMPIRPAKQ